MSVRAIHKCFECKEKFRTDEMINYNNKWYCKKCYEDKLARERFSDKVCKIFGVKAPGPRIWTERKRIIETYGYTDDTIVDCIEYAYNVEHITKKTITLYFVNPPMVEKMKAYKRANQAKAISLAQATNQQTFEHIVPIKENTKNQKKIYNPDDWLGD